MDTDIWNGSGSGRRKMRIGLMGFEFQSPNKGCEALVYSFLSIIRNDLKSQDVIYNSSGTELGQVPEYFNEIKFVNIVIN